MIERDFDRAKDWALIKIAELLEENEDALQKAWDNTEEDEKLSLNLKAKMKRVSPTQIEVQADVSFVESKCKVSEETVFDGQENLFG